VQGAPIIIVSAYRGIAIIDVSYMVFLRVRECLVAQA